MWKPVETFQNNKGCKLAKVVVFIPTLPFSKYKFVVHLSNIAFTKMRPCTPLLSYENKSL